MKSKLFAALLIMCFSAFSTVHAQTVDEIVNKYITARGGADKLNTINSSITKGNLNVNGMKIPINISVEDGKAMRVDFTFNGMTGYQIITTTQGWNFSPFQGQTKTEPMTDDDVKKNQDALDAKDDLLDYAKKGTTIQSLGNEDVEGSDCYKLKLTYKSGKEKTFFIATDDSLLVKTSEKVTVNGQEQDNNTTFANYKVVNGIKFPFSITSPMGLIEVDTITIDPQIDESIFKPSTN